MIFAFTAICYKLLKLKLPQEFQSICTCIFVTTNKRTELDSSDIKVEVFELYYKLRWCVFWRFSMIFGGWSGGAKVLCILHHWGVQLILAYSWARPAILVVGKSRGGMFLFLLFLHFHSCSSFFPVPLFHLLYSLLSLFSLSLGDDTKWPSRVDVSLNPNTIKIDDFRFYAICNKLFKLKLPKEFQSICTCIFVTTNKRTELDSSDIKVDVFELYYKLRWLRFLAIFDDFRIYRNL